MAGEIAQQLGTLAAFGEDWNLIPSTPIRYFKMACNRRSRIRHFLTSTVTHMYVHTYRHTNQKSRDNVHIYAINTMHVCFLLLEALNTKSV